MKRLVYILLSLGFLLIILSWVINGYQNQKRIKQVNDSTAKARAAKAAKKERETSDVNQDEKTELEAERQGED